MDLREQPSHPFLRHPWETTRCRFFCQIIEQVAKKNSIKQFIDVGSGDGWFTNQAVKRLDNDVRATCWDINYDDRDCQNSTNAITFVKDQPASQYDIAVMLDILEHVEDDRGFLKNIVDDNVRDNGWALISVPAWRFLFCSHDEFLKHFRRYSPKVIKSAISHAGLEIIKSGGLFHSLLIPRTMSTLKERVLGGSRKDG